jgi:recombinational DNA repair protein RecR
MPGTRITLKERKEKNNEKLKDLYNNYVLSRKKVNTLEKRKTVTICFNGSYDELIELMEIKKHEMKEIEKDLKTERINVHWLWIKYKRLKNKVDSQTRLDKMKEEIQEMKKEETILAKTNKQLAASFDTKMLDKLPLEVVDIIATYLPYEVRNSLIKERKPFRLFKNLTTCTLRSFLMNICYTREYFSLLSEEEKQTYIYKPENNPHLYLPNLQNPHHGHFAWNPDWLQYTKKEEIETRIKYIFHLFNKSCPKGAYKLMRMFIVLIKPDKKYDKYDGSWTRLTSIPV